jgi:parallel beta-helix repeat protein
MKKLLVLFAVLLNFVFVSLVSSTTYYVNDTKGNDSWDYLSPVRDGVPANNYSVIQGGYTGIGNIILNPLGDEDSDGDGLNDWDEINVYGTDPFNWDSDGDTLSDGNEVNIYCTNPLDADSDDDGLNDYDEINMYGTDPLNWDSDSDNLSDGAEVNAYFTNPLNWDSDWDNLSDGDEVNVYSTDPNNWDSDWDMLSDGEEVDVYYTNPLDWDTDWDGLSDGAEVNKYGTNPLDADSDGDGLNDYDEISAYGTDPLNWDSDFDNLSDSNELNLYYTDPLDEDSDDDGLYDGEEIVGGTNPLHPDNAEKTYYVNDATGSDTYDGLAAIWDGIHGPKLTIQAGIDATITGWDYIVQVADGTYTGIGNKDLSFNGKAIMLKSENGAFTCIIDCENSGRALYFNSGELADSIIYGFTIVNGNAQFAGGIACEASSPTIVNCYIKNNTATDYYGGGIWCWGSDPIIENCIITGNSAGEFGGGIHCEWSAPSITNCIIAGNTVFSYGGGGISCIWSSAPVVENCTMTGNVGWGGAVACWNGSTPAFANCILWNNSPNEVDDWDGTPTISYSDVQGGYTGTGNINANPLFCSGPLHNYYLSQTICGQAADSPCVDAGSDTAVNLGIDYLSTRTDGAGDMGIVDMGYHAPYALRLGRIECSGDNVTIYWNALPRGSYTVQWSIDMQTWNDVYVGATGSWTDIGGGLVSKKYYRVAEE